MNPLPTHIQVGPMRYTLAIDQAAINEINPTAFGRTRNKEQSIVLSAGQGPDQEADTVLHETLHACFTVAGISERMTDTLAEETINALSPLLLDTLRRNPELVAYLLDTPAQEAS